VLVEETETTTTIATPEPSTPTNLPPTPTNTLLTPSDTPTSVPSTPTPVPPTSTPAPSKTPGPRTKRQNGVHALLIVPDQYGANYFLMKDNFEWFGWQVTTTGVDTFSQPCAVFAEPHGCKNIKVDVTISDITDISAYDVVAIMPSSQFSGGNEPYHDLLDDEGTLGLIRSAVDEGLVVYAPCTGVRVLSTAGVIDGINVTGKGSYEREYLEAGAIYLGEPHPPVIDQNIVTSVRNLYYHVQTGEAWTTSLENLEIIWWENTQIE
jgi:putative intracellular protease/amidase